jgi:hypothetical protein
MSVLMMSVLVMIVLLMIVLLMMSFDLNSTEELLANYLFQFY